MRTHKGFLSFLQEICILLDVGQRREGGKERRREGGGVMRSESDIRI